MQRAIRALAVCLVFAGAAAHSASPLPPRRPADFGSTRTLPNLRNDLPIERRSADELNEACLARLTDLGVDYELVAPQQDGACIVETPVRLRALDASRNSRSLIAFPDRPLTDCRLAGPLADWLREAVSPLFRSRLGASLRTVATGVGYECRTRNRDPGSKLSAHGLGLALDISAFELADRQRVRIGATDDPAAEGAFEVIRKSACGWFTTVLGPGSPDNLHENHLHVDTQSHGSGEGYKICQ
jgi:hypothetical protein